MKTKAPRLVDEPDDRFAAVLFRAGLDEEPDRGALGRAEAALGLGVGAGLAITALGAAKASAHAGAGPALAGASAGSIAKWVGIGLISGVVTVGGARYGTDPALRAEVARLGSGAANSRSVPAPAARPRDAARAAPLPLEEAPSRETPPQPEVPVAPPSLSSGAGAGAGQRPAPGAPKAPVSPPAERAATEAPSAGVAAAFPDERPAVLSLANELAILERARRALFAGQSGAVLKELEAYDRAPGKAVLESEAELLAVEALVQQGRLREAQARAQRSLARSPQGPHAQRLREVIALPGP
jgi:hypothetical protein